MKRRYQHQNNDKLLMTPGQMQYWLDKGCTASFVAVGKWNGIVKWLQTSSISHIRASVQDAGFWIRVIGWQSCALCYTYYDDEADEPCHQCPYARKYIGCNERASKFHPLTTALSDLAEREEYYTYQQRQLVIEWATRIRDELLQLWASQP